MIKGKYIIFCSKGGCPLDLSKQFERYLVSGKTRQNEHNSNVKRPINLKKLWETCTAHINLPDIYSRGY